MIEGSELFQRTIAADYGDPHRNELMQSEWAPTPWMMDVQVNENRDILRHWCYRNFGRESSPMHEHEGSWKQASVTLNGYSWFGFKTESMMQRFEEFCRGL